MGKTKTQFVGDTPEKPKKDKKRQKGVKMVEMPTEVLVPEASAKGKKARAARVRGKKYIEARAKVDRNRLYSIKDAVSLVKETSVSSFDGTVEVHLVVKKEGISATLSLPHSTGKTKKVEVADEDTLKKLEKGTVDFDVLLATAEMMPKLVPFARLLGPKGLMPNPKNGTLIKSPKDAEKFNSARVVIKTDKGAPVIHTIVGKVSMKDTELAENIDTIFAAIAKGQIVKAYLTSTMGPSVKVAVS